MNSYVHAAFHTFQLLNSLLDLMTFYNQSSLNIVTKYGFFSDQIIGTETLLKLSDLCWIKSKCNYECYSPYGNMVHMFDVYIPFVSHFWEIWWTMIWTWRTCRMCIASFSFYGLNTGVTCLFQICDEISGMLISSLKIWLIFHNGCFFKSGWSNRCSFWVKELRKSKGYVSFDAVLV